MHGASLTPEDRLCLLFARGRFSPEIAAPAVKQLDAGVDWEALLECARIHGLVPLVYHRLRALEFRGVPETIRRRLTDTFGTNAIRNELLTRELISVLTRLETAGVPVIPLKGIALAESVYGDSALRVCADLNVLIQPKHLLECVTLLRSSGYQDRLADPALVRLVSRYGKDCALIREEGRLTYPLQIHCGWICGGPAERDLLADVWDEALPRPFHSAPAHAMSPEWEFLYLAVHAARHGIFPFKWLVDLDWLVVRGALDWKDVQAKARSRGWQRVVESCLAACAELLETPIPESFATASTAARASVRISVPGPLSIPREALFTARLLPSLGKKVQFFLLRLFVPTPADDEFLHLPSGLFFLYYLLRPLRLTVSVAGWMIQAGMAKFRRTVD